MHDEVPLIQVTVRMKAVNRISLITTHIGK